MATLQYEPDPKAFSGGASENSSKMLLDTMQQEHCSDDALTTVINILLMEIKHLKSQLDAKNGCHKCSPGNKAAAAVTRSSSLKLSEKSINRLSYKKVLTRMCSQESDAQRRMESDMLNIKSNCQAPASKGARKQQRPPRELHQSPHSKVVANLKNCKFCDLPHVWGKENCPAYGKICKQCFHRNHLETACRTKIDRLKSCKSSHFAYKKTLKVNNETEVAKKKHLIQIKDPMEVAGKDLKDKADKTPKGVQPAAVVTLTAKFKDPPEINDELSQEVDEECNNINETEDISKKNIRGETGNTENENMDDQADVSGKKETTVKLTKQIFRKIHPYRLENMEAEIDNLLLFLDPQAHPTYKNLIGKRLDWMADLAKQELSENDYKFFKGQMDWTFKTKKNNLYPEELKCNEDVKSSLDKCHTKKTNTKHKKKKNFQRKS